MGHHGNDLGSLPAVCFLLLSEQFSETLHVHLVLLNVGEAPFVNEEFTDAEFSVVVPEFSSALYPVLPLCVN
jgi:hypothetical protein